MIRRDFMKLAGAAVAGMLGAGDIAAKPERLTEEQLNIVFERILEHGKWKVKHPWKGGPDPTRQFIQFPLRYSDMNWFTHPYPDSFKILA